MWSYCVIHLKYLVNATKKVSLFVLDRLIFERNVNISICFVPEM